MKDLKSLTPTRAVSPGPRRQVFAVGVEFTSEGPTGRLKGESIAMSMDGKGCWRDNIFVEQVCESIEYEEVYLHAYESVCEPAPPSAGTSTFTTPLRPLQPGRQTPDQISFNRTPELWRCEPDTKAGGEMMESDETYSRITHRLDDDVAAMIDDGAHFYLAGELGGSLEIHPEFPNGVVY